MNDKGFSLLDSVFSIFLASICCAVPAVSAGLQLRAFEKSRLLTERIEREAAAIQLTAAHAVRRPPEPAAEIPVLDGLAADCDEPKTAAGRSLGLTRCTLLPRTRRFYLWSDFDAQ